MDLQPSQNNYSEGDRLQTSESLSGFFSRMTVSNKTMERIMRQDSNLSPYDGFRIGGIGKVLNLIGLNQRKHHIIYKVSSGEFAIPMEFTGKLMFDIHPRIAYNLADQDFSRVLTLHQDFKRKELMKEGKSISKFPEFSRNSLRTEFSSRMSFSEDRIIGYKGKEKDLSKVLTQEIRPVVGRYEGMLEIAGYEILVTGVAGRENGSMTLGISFLEDRKPWGRKGNGICTAKPGVFLKKQGKPYLLLQEGIFHKNPNTQYGNSRSQNHDRMSIWNALVLRRENAFNRIMPINFRSKRGDFDAKLNHPKMQDKRKFGKVLLSFRQQGLIESDSFHKKSEEEIENLKEALEELKTMDISEERIRSKLQYVRYKPIQMNMEDKNDMRMIIKEHINLGLIEPGISANSGPGFLIKMESESKKFTAFSTPQGQYIWNVLPMGLANAPQIFQRKMDNLFNDYFEFIFVYIDDILIASKNMKEHIKHLEIFSDACYKEGLVLSEKKATIAVNKIEFLGILIDETGIELQKHIVEKIRNFPDILKDKKQLQSFLGVVNFAGIFIKDLAKYRKDFRPLLKETESAKWKWEEIHTQRVRELKQVCNNLPKLAIPQDEDELVVYTDANDYRWATVLMKKTTTGEEPCRYTGGLFTEQQARVWHINEKEFFAVWKAFKKWHLFLLAKEFTLKVDNTNVKTFLKNKLESKIEKAQMEASEANSIMLRLRHLRENLEELNKKFGRLAVNAQVAGQIQRADLDTVQIAIRTTMVASTSLWNDLQEPIRKASYSEMTNELRKHDTRHALRGVQTSDDSSQPSASGVKEEKISLRPMTSTSKPNTNELSFSSSSAWQVYQWMWEKLISRKGVNPSKTIIETSGKYNRVWMLEGSKPEEVRKWYEFGALASVYTMSPSFPKISKLPDWISGAVYDSWQNNPHLKRGDILELKFVSVAPEIAGKRSHPAFHFIKLQRPDMVAFNRIKAASEEAPLVSAISEDDISTRRAWGFWVCLTEMDKVKYPFKIFSNKVNGSFLLNSMTGKSTEFAKSMFEKKRMLIWENKLPATEATRMKTCNMLHVGLGVSTSRARVELDHFW
ncbi:putative enzymatic polyprotein [Sesamum angolense]|uniref:Enzymatic polyprotein n=1 Tax=Sesamum angolense TaxID=2727404 RepID=A0AAE1WBP6_9LAMI|nr:putative enzymatic polyprotein [Sesamum angolense]